MDLAQFAGADYADLTLADATYRVGELTLREWAPVQAWIKATVPGPLASLGSPDFAALPPAIKRELLGEALRQDRSGWPPAIGTLPWLEAVDRDGGHAVVLLAILARHNPGITLERCRAIAELARPSEILPPILAALGMLGPKSPAPASPIPASPGARPATTSETSPTSSPAPGDGPAGTSST